MQTFAETELLQACRALFGNQPKGGRAFLRSLSLSWLKSAYRRRALQVHPDLHSHELPHVQQRYARLFQELTGSYRLLCRYLDQKARLKGPPFAVPPSEAAREGFGTRSWAAAGSVKPPPAASGAGSGVSGPPAASRQHPSKVPPWRMRLGEFLYYSGQISWTALIEALVHQRKERPRLGDIAKRWGWLSEDQIVALLQQRRPGERIGELFVRCNRMTAFRLGMLLGHQQRHSKPIGGYFVEAGLLSPAALRASLLRQDDHNRQHARPR